MAEAFEYAIKKDVRNNPIVRQVDEARQRELWTSVGLAVLLVAGRCCSRRGSTSNCCGTATRSGRAAEASRPPRKTSRARLRLEIDTLKSPKRIEMLAHRAA